LQSSLGIIANWHNALLLAFTHNFKEALLQMKVTELQADEFSYSYPGVEQNHDNGLVSGITGIFMIE